MVCGEKLWEKPACWTWWSYITSHPNAGDQTPITLERGKNINHWVGQQFEYWYLFANRSYTTYSKVGSAYTGRHGRNRLPKSPQFSLLIGGNRGSYFNTFFWKQFVPLNTFCNNFRPNIKNFSPCPRCRLIYGKILPKVTTCHLFRNTGQQTAKTNRIKTENIVIILFANTVETVPVVTSIKQPLAFEGKYFVISC